MSDNYLEPFVISKAINNTIQKKMPSSKMLEPAINRIYTLNSMTKEERLEYFKKRNGLTHGPGKRKKRKK